ncbi:MAG: hypothetical protein HGA47_07260 [Zoogloea sp.]|nr:hypothetical protein [Zoogloea sp.]
MVTTAFCCDAAARRAASVRTHRPRLHSPFFGGNGDGTTLHRYFDDEFVARFLNDALAGRLLGTQQQAWHAEDRFGRHTDAPALRLPMHRSFYLACCEVNCELPGHVAWDPRKVRSAGLVVRRLPAAGAPQRWMIADGQALGWVDGEITGCDPDQVRRLTRRGLLPARFPEPPYTGEECSPMHALLVRRRDADGVERNHTLLWGYVPLGGSYRQAEPAASATQSLDFGAEHLWPLGTQGAHAWQPADGMLAYWGVPTTALAELLETLLLRFRIVDAGDADNAPLRALLGRLYFYAPADGHLSLDAPAPQPEERAESLLAWLDRSGPALLGWLDRLHRGELVIGSARLPDQTGTDADGQPVAGLRYDELYVSEQDAADLRDLVALRSSRAVARQDADLALPRYGQGDDDRFVVMPFLRWDDECGCERIAWGPPSVPFRVASPLDPDAQRPTTVVLPSLDDLKRGAARGVSLLAPKSLADVLTRIKPDMDMKAGGAGNRAGSCFSFSFSLPAITLCATILLMVVINLLNLFLGWLPWAFLALPRLCARLLKEK